VRDRLDDWLLTAAVVITVVLAWVGLGQVCLFRCGWSWLWASTGDSRS
jgi:hypothetical protein